MRIVLCSVLLMSTMAVGSGRGAAQHFVVRHGDIVVDVYVSHAAVPMQRVASGGWNSANAPVVVHVRDGEMTPVTIWATPAYGLVDLPGRHVDVTYLARYRAAGDRRDAEPIRAGVPLRPDPRRSDGRAAVDVPLVAGASLTLTLDVRHGTGTTTLRNQKEPVRNVAFGAP
jgi:hypothetical protein